MSLDIWLTSNSGEELMNCNITHNLTSMWKAAGVYDALYKSTGNTAADVLPALEEGVAKLIGNPVYYQQFDAPNGWGKYKQAVPWLRSVAEKFKEHPDSVIGVSV